MTDKEVKIDVANISRDLSNLELNFKKLRDNLLDAVSLIRKDFDVKGGELNFKYENIRDCDDSLSTIEFFLKILHTRFDRIKLYQYQRENELLQNKELIELRARIKDLER